ncbi:endonuclease III [Candidatus Giovannonibacteria bacterium RIFCSPLOWO2_02_FULL_43_11b]|uniref:Endonuclease III n=1 Tax=Candidatus Giovannonibacteria bacterium RIFCSPHIGHO2_12_FULL_43_15 TaxID=1798341 RepID=A0A1F5WR95_9BACT|nr:MAG: endonuclease III [Candidatus Giovannonibacteria bacterium RIFCSPHIGHO2_01_FULL_43_100]OGF66616.1 MAG: endonuclease III [Candidatus Giovannonibacteria bacterium RIFCSPHIGHO2_02_FULL_43_32]OGF77771.1 MAG: endonuclease III [Candidatus Giovannonibacteria bacterium RIFCSPHIGHO2_12_FULL_43_15]OGF89489.1 MAG: endonuclease III [Candidatus Giovannonibacteria bacterium RIFCSPLOWO2_02_FULL_43_11b]OGF92276.1 MAG: endonuclease III [Candidatus Giovannonibacteria bacterium RIFCSPLOWO2_12_FULL_43_11c]
MTKKERAKKILAALRKLYPDAKIALKYRNNMQLLAAVIMSAQCTDKKVNEVTEKLFKKYKSVADFADADIKTFEKEIYQTGFYHAKSRNIIASAKMIRREFKGVLPKTMEEILRLPGVARKTANVVLGNAYGVVEGIAVDTHVKRLSKALGLTTETDPVKIERDLMQIIPKKDWFKFTYMLIDYGRKHCPARPHNHDSCPLIRIK